MLAGMAGGVAEACALQPLDVCKTRLQLDAAIRPAPIATVARRAGGSLYSVTQLTRIAAATRPSAPTTKRYTGLVHCGQTIVRQEGVRALYKGLTPFVTHLVLKYAFRFGSFAYVREYLRPHVGSDRKANFLAGLTAGTSEAVLIVTPFEVVKTRLQQQMGTSAGARAGHAYTGPVHCAATTVRQEGVRALWRGAAPTIIRQGSNQAMNFLAFSELNRVAWGKHDGDGVVLAPWKTALSGLLAGSLGPLCNAPMDVCKTRLMAQARRQQQAAHTIGAPRVYRGLAHAFTTILREEGPAALYKGLLVRLLRLAPGQAITWTVVSRVVSLYERRELMRDAGGDGDGPRRTGR